MPSASVKRNLWTVTVWLESLCPVTLLQDNCSQKGVPSRKWADLLELKRHSDLKWRDTDVPPPAAPKGGGSHASAVPLQPSPENTPTHRPVNCLHSHPLAL
ncbi:hypothetical protein JOB18_033199 [Solea senegalensis]|uniref:Uncharacterized protein n=1 Tax=Solea senegalensis TaxID=28829 RepID=A0AAV6QYS4_SOLSE|nr:hypothetical protein JOB18_033199 [Solea senegalensis]